MSILRDSLKFRDESLTNFFFPKECEVPSLIQKLILCSNFKQAFSLMLSLFQQLQPNFLNQEI